MSRRMVGVLLLLGASLTIGILAGEQFFQLFRKTVPPMALSGFSVSAAHGIFLTYGLVLGLILCGWALLTVVLSGFFRNTDSTPRPSRQS